MKPKNQRLILGVMALSAVVGAGLLAATGLRSQAAFFYAPGDVAKAKPAMDRAVRLGGMVVKGSIKRDADGVTTRFVVEDGIATVPVTFRGIAPDLFREGSGVIAEGRFAPGGGFVADNLLAKHDERYVPPELAGKMHKTETLKN